MSFITRIYDFRGFQQVFVLLCTFANYNYCNLYWQSDSSDYMFDHDLNVVASVEIALNELLAIMWSN